MLTLRFCICFLTELADCWSYMSWQYANIMLGLPLHAVFVAILQQTVLHIFQSLEVGSYDETITQFWLAVEYKN